MPRPAVKLTMAGMGSRSKVVKRGGYRESMATVLVAVYLPALVAFAAGVGHCDVCRRTWLTHVCVIPGFIIELLTARMALGFRHFGDRTALAIASLVQIVWIAGWVWLARHGRGWRWGVAVVAGTLSSLGAFWMYALIRA